MTTTTNDSNREAPERDSPQDAARSLPKVIRPRSRWTRALAMILLAVLLAVSVFYALVQRGNAAELADSLATSQSSLRETRVDLSSTKETLVTTEDDLAQANTNLADAEATVESCADVTTAASELWDSSESLLAALTSAVDGDFGTADIAAASDNIDAVSGLIEDNGFVSITDLLEACGDSATIT